MSYQDGIAAINLEMPKRVPRTEYSADFHWDLVNAVLGTKIGPRDDKAIQDKASRDFRRAWSYDFFWNALTHDEVFGEKKSRMGHAEYAAQGVDFNTNVQKFYTDPVEALRFDPWKLYGTRDRRLLTKEYEENYRKVLSENPESVNMTGIFITMMSGFIWIFGWEMLLTMAGYDADEFGGVADRYAGWIRQYFDALADADVPIVMLHDDIVWTSGAFIDPAWYRKYIFPNYKKLFRPLIDSGKKIMYTSDGNYTEFIDDIAATGVHGFILEPCTDMKYIARKYGKTHVFIGNADTRILLNGSKEDIYNEVKRCMDIGKDCPGFFMAVGNHIPPNTPVENALYYNEVYQKLGQR